MSASAFLFLGDSILVASAGAIFPCGGASQETKASRPAEGKRKGGRKALPYGSYDHRIASTVPLVFSS